MIGLRTFFALFVILTCANLWAETNINQLLENIRPYVTTAHYEQLCKRCEHIALLITTAPKKEQAVLMKRLMQAVNTQQETRSQELFTSIERDAQAQSFKGKRFIPYQVPFDYLGNQFAQFNHLAPVWKVLSIVGVCSATYLIVKLIKNIAARSELSDNNFEEQYEEDRTAALALRNATESLGRLRRWRK